MSAIEGQHGLMELNERIALVTGAATGAGRAMATRLAAGGAAVVVADIDAAGGRATVRLLEAAGGRAAFTRADVTVEPDVRAMVAFAEATFGGLDILVNNAGGTPAPHFPEASSDHWRRTLDLNLTGPMLAIQHALPALRRRGGGAIVNISSVAGHGTWPNRSPEYAAAKAGLIRLTVVLAPLAERASVRVNCVVPNWILTEKVSAEIAKLTKEERDRLPGPMASMEEIAEAVLSVIRDDSLAGRVLICWTGTEWELLPAAEPGA
jgi:3-oxoacyl-[acyl-carrier protein] reductase